MNSINFIKGRIIIFSAFLFILPFCLFSEILDTAVVKINENNKYFKNACVLFDVNSKYLKSIVLVERLLNYDWSDDALDEIFARNGLNSSLGFCQVKLKTAYFIEKQLNDSSSNFYLGKKFESILKVSESPMKLIRKLNNDSLNIIYAAAYIKIISTYWKKSGYPLNNRPDILGTLYSTGLFNVNGNIRKPNADPKPNNFGKLVLKQLNIFK